ncbi:isochorismatase family cysteine hydrolase [Falsibacillus albus]|uniref:Cysteine hydrolase n=1 Tax=Falsibacillus albus TaxID=2478915 RepID=A0A3L7JGW7_9BACI|nr:isochorismatase family cysteine hydrolase [Falsibacillus albus]RLQ90018.1 cysteine hydrolase [Falsibacillus albus]
MNKVTSKFALLIIDIINPFDFQHGRSLADHTLKIVEPISNLKQVCREKDIPIIYINDHYNLWQANLETIYKKCSNELNKKILAKLKPDDKDYFLIKPKHSAFYGTALNTLLYHLEADSLILTGIAGNICVLFTANDAYMREYSLYVPNDCLASVAEEDNTYALRMMKNVLQANIDDSTTLIEDQL